MTFLLRATGPALVSWPVSLLVVVWSMVLALLGTGAAVSGALPARVALAGVGGAAACAMVAAAWWIVLRRVDGSARIVLAFAAVVLAGLARGLLVQVGFVLLGFAEGPASTVIVRALPSVFTIPFAFLVGAAGLAAIRAYRETSARLIAEQQRLVALLAASTTGIEERQTSALEQVQRRLDEELQALALQTPPSAIAALENLAGEVVRPLSHSLARDLPTWDEPVADPPRVGVIDVLRDPVPQAAIRPVVLPVAMSILALPGALVIYQPRNGLLTALTGLIVLGCVLALGRLWLTRVPPRRPALVWGAILLILVTAAIVTSAAARLAEGGDPSAGAIPSLALFVVPVFGIIIAILSMVGARMGSITAALEDTTAQLQWTLARVNTAQWEQSGRLSRALHGPVQTLLHARLLRLRQEVATAGMSEVDLDHLRTDLQDALASTLAPASAPPAAALVLSDTTETWQGLASIVWRVSPGAESVLAQDPLCARAVADLATEAVSNAVRHGRATRVDVDIEVDGDVGVSGDGLMRLVVIDDGQVPESRGAGLGTTLLTRCTYDWSLVPDPTTLTARLPCEHRHRTGPAELRRTWH